MRVYHLSWTLLCFATSQRALDLLTFWVSGPYLSWEPNNWRRGICRVFEPSERGDNVPVYCLGRKALQSTTSMVSAHSITSPLRQSHDHDLLNLLHCWCSWALLLPSWGSTHVCLLSFSAFLLVSASPCVFVVLHTQYVVYYFIISRARGGGNWYSRLLTSFGADTRAQRQLELNGAYSIVHGS